MRFAWLSKQRGLSPPSHRNSAYRLALIVYNTVWWVPIITTILGLTSYETGLIAFLAVTVLRAVINLYRNNVLPFEQGRGFPLRIP